MSVMENGKLTIILGCMFSGKSTELIRLIRRYRSIDKNVMVIKHSIDHRYDSSHVTSHDQEKIESVMITDLSNVKDRPEFKTADVIVVEEAQFFNELYNHVIYWVDTLKKNVIVAGLDGDYNRQPFLNGELLKLIPVCDEIKKLTGYCQICHCEAIFTKRVNTDTTDQIVVGSKDIYIPVCRKHYL